MGYIGFVCLWSGSRVDRSQQHAFWRSTNNVSRTMSGMPLLHDESLRSCSPQNETTGIQRYYWLLLITFNWIPIRTLNLKSWTVVVLTKVCSDHYLSIPAITLIWSGRQDGRLIKTSPLWIVVRAGRPHLLIVIWTKGHQAFFVLWTHPTILMG